MENNERKYQEILAAMFAQRERFFDPRTGPSEVHEIMHELNSLTRAMLELAKS